MRRARHRIILVACALAFLPACRAAGRGHDEAAPSAASGDSSSMAAEHTVAPPGGFDGRIMSSDLLVYGRHRLDRASVAKIERTEGVVDVEPLTVSEVSIEDRVYRIAAVDPGSYRRYTPEASASLTEAWDRVAAGDLAITQDMGAALDVDSGAIRLGNDQDAPVVTVGALVPQIPQIDGVVNRTWARPLGMRSGNALIVSTGYASPQKVQPMLARILGRRGSVLILGPDLPVGAQQTAFLTGGSVAAAVGTFTYHVLGGGRIRPDPAWVAANITTEEVPILGTVTCHRVMLPQLRAALEEIQARGLADKLHPDEYAGCYVPRYIANTDSLSLHSFGIAFDVNVPGNQRGTKGEIDRTVVSIFKKWGFAWGGDWKWTDPMHFEMDALVEPR